MERVCESGDIWAESLALSYRVLIESSFVSSIRGLVNRGFTQKHFSLESFIEKFFFHAENGRTIIALTTAITK